MIFPRPFTNQIPHFRGHFFNPLANHDPFDKDSADQKEIRKFMQHLSKLMNEEIDHLFLKAISKDIESFSAGLEMVTSKLMATYSAKGNEFLDVPPQIEMERFFLSNMTLSQLEKNTLDVIRCLNRIKKLAYIYHSEEVISEIMKTKTFESITSMLRYSIRIEILLELLTFLANSLELSVFCASNSNIARVIKPYFEQLSKIDWVGAAKTLPEEINCAEFREKEEFLKILNFDKKLIRKIKALQADDLKKFGAREKPLKLELASKSNALQNQSLGDVANAVNLTLIYNFLSRETFHIADLVNLGAVCEILDVRLSNAPSAETQVSKNNRIDSLKTFFQNTQLLAEARIKLKLDIVAAWGVTAVPYLFTKYGKHGKKSSRKNGKNEENELNVLAELIRHDISEIKNAKTTKAGKKAKQNLSVTNEYFAYYLVSKLHTVVGMLRSNRLSFQSGETRKMVPELFGELVELVESKFFVDSLQEFTRELIAVLTFCVYPGYIIKYEWFSALTKAFKAILSQTQQNGKENGRTIHSYSTDTKQNISDFMLLLVKMVRRLKEDSLAVEEKNSWWKNRGSEFFQAISDAVHRKLITGSSLAQSIELIALLSKIHSVQAANYVDESKIISLIKIVFDSVDAGTFATIYSNPDYLQPMRALMQIYITNDTAIQLVKRMMDIYRDMNYSRIRPLSKVSDLHSVMPKTLSFILTILKEPYKQEEFLLSYFKLAQEFYHIVQKQLEDKFNEAKEIAKSGSKVVFNNHLFYRCQIAIFLPLMLQKEYSRENRNRFPKTAKVIIQYFETLTIQIPLLNQFKSLCNYLTSTSVRDASYLIRDYASDISNLIRRLGNEVAENKSLSEAFSSKEKEWFAKNLFSWFEIITDLQYYYCLEDDHIDIQIHYPHYFLGIVDTIVGFKDILEKPMKDNELVLRVFRKFEPILIKITPTSNRDITLNETWVNCIRWVHEFAVSLFDETPLKQAAEKLSANPQIVKILSDSLKLPTSERLNGEMMVVEEQEQAVKAKNAQLVENFLKDINIEPFNFIFEHIKRYLEEDSHRQVISLNFFLNFLRTISNRFPERKVIFLIFSNYIAGYFLRLKEAFTQEGKAHIWFKSGITVKMLILMNFTSHLKFKGHTSMENFKIADILIDMVVCLIENVVEEYENSSGLEIPLSIHSSLIDLLCVAREAILSDEVRKSIQEQVYVPFINAKYRIVRAIIRLIKKSEFHNVYFLKEFYNIIIHTIHSFLKSNRKTYIEHLVVKDIFDKESNHLQVDNKNGSYKNLSDLVASHNADKIQQQQQQHPNTIMVLEESREKHKEEEKKNSEVVNKEDKMVIEEDRSQTLPDGASTRNNQNSRSKPGGENDSNLQEFLKTLNPAMQKDIMIILEELVLPQQTTEEKNIERSNNLEIEAQINGTTATNHSAQSNEQTSGLPNDFLKNLPKDKVAPVLNRMCQMGVLERNATISMDINKFLEEMESEEREEVLLNSSEQLMKLLNQNLKKQLEKAKNKKYEKNEEPFLLNLLSEDLFNDAKFLESLLYIIFYTGDSLIKSKYSLTVVKVFLKSEAIYKRFREIALCLLADSSSFFDLLFMSRPYQEQSQSILNRSSIEEFTLAESTILESFFSKFDEEMCEFLVSDTPVFVHSKDLVHNSPLIKQIIHKILSSREESSILRRWMVRVKNRTPLYLKVMEQAIIKTITFVGDLTGMLSKLSHNPALKTKLKKELEFCFLTLFNIALSSDSVQVHFIFQGAFIAIQDKEAMLLAEGVINQLMYDLIHQLASSIREFPILPHQTSMFQQEYVYLLSVVRTFQDVVDYLFYLIDYSTRKGKRSFAQSSEQKHKAVVENFLQLEELHFILNLIKDNPHYFDVLPDLVNVPFQLYFMKNITIGDRQVETLKRLTNNKAGYQHDEFELKDEEETDFNPGVNQQESEGMMNIEPISKIREPSRSVEKVSKLLLELIQKYQNHPEFVRIFVMRIQNHPKTRDIIKSALNFENRRAYLRSQIQKLKSTGELRLYLHRDNTLRDSFGVLKQMAPENLKRTIRISFIGEEAIDEGGVFREWIEKLSREIIDPQYGLFVETQTPGIYQPNPNSQIQENHLDYFEFIGKIIAKALLEGVAMNCYFPNSFYKKLLGEVAIFNDFREYDPQLFENLGWILKNPVEGLELNFTYEMMYLGKREQIELVPNGSNLPVTEENKQEYVNLICEHKMIKSIQHQMDSILKGFYCLVPKEELTIFNSTELELLISGLPDYDVDDLRKNTMYVGYNEHSTVIIWFWDILRNFDQASRANFLHLISGSSKPPIDGFQSKRLTISRQANSESLPTAHTCAFQLNLPDYDSRDKLYRKLKIAIAFCEGFGMR